METICTASIGREIETEISAPRQKRRELTLQHSNGPVMDKGFDAESIVGRETKDGFC
jgi:hypothetical protein